MTELDLWLKKATRRLSKESAMKVRAEIEQHFEMARETAISGGAGEAEASRIALRELGDAREANRAYRKVLLTWAEAALLRETDFEPRAICSRPWLKWTSLLLPAVMLLGSAGALLIHQRMLALGSLLAGMIMALSFVVPLLPVYTRKRGRVVRGIRWALVICIIPLLCMNNSLQWSVISAGAVLLPIIWAEWTRFSIRRKLPLAEWPKQLYL